MEEDAPSQPRAPALSRKLCEGSIRGHVACAGTRAWDAAVDCDRDEGAADAPIAVMALGSMGSRPLSPALLRVGERSPSCTCQVQRHPHNGCVQPGGESPGSAV